MISPVPNENMEFDISYTLGYQMTDSGFLQFRFEFRPTPGFWLDSGWFEISSSKPEIIRLCGQFWDSNASWQKLLTVEGLSPGRYFTELRTRVSLDEQISIRLGESDLPEDILPIDVAYLEWSKSMARTKDALGSLMRVEDLCLLKQRTQAVPPQYFAYRGGTVWGSAVNLQPDQWRQLIDTEANERGIQLNTAEDAPDRIDRIVSVTVRREVWRRDQGRCVSCGSMEKLEFDHIIPVARGGSNTVRNIQLLCERCNRRKSSTLG